MMRTIYCRGNVLITNINKIHSRYSNAATSCYFVAFTKHNIIWNHPQLPQNDTQKVQITSFSSYRNNKPSLNNARIPSMQYRAQNDQTIFMLKPIPPTFAADGSYIVLRRPGRMLLEFVPKDPLWGTPQWNEKRCVALSVNEMGMFLVPNRIGIKLTREEPVNVDGSLSQFDQKLFEVKQKEDGSIILSIDYTRDVVAPHHTVSHEGPIEYRMLPEEFEVVKLLFQKAVPIFIGWTPLMDMRLDQSVKKAESGKVDTLESMFRVEDDDDPF